MSKPGFRYVMGTVCILAVIASGLSAQAPRSMPPPSAIDELLVEVRGLRAELNQAAGASIRAQLLVARLQLQERRIHVLAEQLAETRRVLSLEESKQIEKTAEFQRLEEVGRSADTPPQERRAIAELIPNVKEEVAQIYRQLEQLRMQETDLANQLASEQGRWVEFNDRLDALERSLPVR